MKNKLKLKYIMVIMVVLISVPVMVMMYLSFNTNTPTTADFLDIIGEFEIERTDGGYYTFVDAKTGKEIDRTARGVFEGDELILADNSRYQVVEIEKDTVICKYLGKEKISWFPQEKAVLGDMQVGEQNKSVAIYSTHTAESYVPTSGTESKPGKGDILQVGKTRANKLEEQGIKAFFSNNKHDPHDANAYQRSRRTAAQLLKNGPAAIIDVHRDGVPDPEFYAREINGKNATQIRLVVGRQNQNMNANLDFAKKLKAFYDEKEPGLVKGIFMAKGNYNQDLAPRSILIEVGTHTNPLDSANNGAVIFSSLLPEFLGLNRGAQPDNNISPGASSSIIWIILALVVGVIGFLILSTGSIKGSVDKVKGLGKEFSSYLGNKRRK